MSETIEKVTFAASDAACYAYPGADQTSLREAFCKGAGWAAGRIEQLETALKWYADQENYDTRQDCPDVLIDGGATARRVVNVLYLLVVSVLVKYLFITSYIIV